MQVFCLAGSAWFQAQFRLPDTAASVTAARVSEGGARPLAEAGHST